MVQQLEAFALQSWQPEFTPWESGERTDSTDFPLTRALPNGVHTPGTHTQQWTFKMSSVFLQSLCQFCHGENSKVCFKILLRRRREN